MSRLRPAIGPGHDRGVTASLEHLDTLLQFPTVHPYKKWWGTHWRLVELADLSISVPAERVQPGIDQEVAWLTSTVGDSCTVDGRSRRHASMEGNAVYAFSRLGFAAHPATRRLVQALIEWQWPAVGTATGVVRPTGRPFTSP